MKDALKSDGEFEIFVRKTLFRIALGVAWIALLVFISDASTYRIRGITPTTADIAMMLTPFGILQNLVFQRDGYLRPFYFSSADRFGLFDDPFLRWGVSVFFLLSLILVILFFAPSRKEG